MKVRARAHGGSVSLALDDAVYELDEVASFIWRELDGRKSIEAIVAAICVSFAADTTRAREDTHEFLEQLAQHFLIEPHEAGLGVTADHAGER